MNKLTVQDLMKLEEYAEQRSAFRERVIAHKRRRTVALGPNMTLLFEDRLTVQYHVQEMLRIERVFERAAIQEELDAYNPLVPDGDNWKATCLIEFPEAEERRVQLGQMRGIEHRIWVQAGAGPRVMAIADEDLDRSDQEKTSAVHFLRFALPAAVIAELRGGAGLRMGVDHPHYAHGVEIPAETREALLQDLQ